MVNHTCVFVILKIESFTELCFCFLQYFWYLELLTRLYPIQQYIILYFDFFVLDPHSPLFIKILFEICVKFGNFLIYTLHWDCDIKGQYFYVVFNNSAYYKVDRFATIVDETILKLGIGVNFLLSLAYFVLVYWHKKSPTIIFFPHEFLSKWIEEFVV